MLCHPVAYLTRAAAHKSAQLGKGTQPQRTIVRCPPGGCDVYLFG